MEFRSGILFSIWTFFSFFAHIKQITVNIRYEMIVYFLLMCNYFEVSRIARACKRVWCAQVFICLHTHSPFNLPFLLEENIYLHGEPNPAPWHAKLLHKMLKLILKTAKLNIRYEMFVYILGFWNRAMQTCLRCSKFGWFWKQLNEQEAGGLLRARGVYIYK